MESATPSFLHPLDRIHCLTNALWDQERKGGAILPTKEGGVPCVAWFPADLPPSSQRVHEVVEQILNDALVLTKFHHQTLQPLPLRFLRSYLERNSNEKVRQMTGFDRQDILENLSALEEENECLLQRWRWHLEHDLLKEKTTYDKFRLLASLPD